MALSVCCDLIYVTRQCGNGCSKLQLSASFAKHGKTALLSCCSRKDQVHFGDLLQLQRPVVPKPSFVVVPSCILFLTPGQRHAQKLLLSVQNAVWHYNNKAKTAEAACSIARSLELSIGQSSTATRARALDWYLKVSSYTASILH